MCICLNDDERAKKIETDTQKVESKTLREKKRSKILTIDCIYAHFHFLLYSSFLYPFKKMFR